LVAFHTSLVTVKTWLQGIKTYLKSDKSNAVSGVLCNNGTMVSSNHSLSHPHFHGLNWRLMYFNSDQVSVDIDIDIILLLLRSIYLDEKKNEIKIIHYDFEL